MDHFYNTIYGFFDKGDFAFYKSILDNLPDNSHIVEIGSFKGRSSSFLAVEIANSNKKIKLDCIDNWLGSAEHQYNGISRDSDVVDGVLYESFLKNMEPVKDYYTPIRMDSLDASKLYRDESLDFVFIDASHDYLSVKKDIEHWTPKVKPGGIISGHDFKDDTELKKAVVEIFRGRVQFGLGSCWWVVK
jgi:Methyltransferase domain